MADKNKDGEQPKAWVPETTFDRVDFRTRSKKSVSKKQQQVSKTTDRARSQDFNTQQNSKTITEDNHRRPLAEPLAGAKPLSATDGQVLKNTGPGSPPAFQPQKINASEAHVVRSRKATPTEAGKAQTVLLARTLLSEPERSREILNQYYWKKESGGTASSGKGRIHTILSGLDDRILMKFYSYLSPLERKQFQDIRRSRYSVIPEERARIYQEFMDSVTRPI